VKSFEAERTAALAEAEAEKVRTADFASELAQLRAQLEATRVLLSEAEGSREQEEKAGQRLQKEIASLRAALTEAGRSQQRHESVTAEQRAEIASLRSAAARAEERQRASETANASLRAEVASLKDELAAARDVGNAAIDALRFETARPAPAALQQPGWRGSVLRRFGFRPRDPLLMAGQ
jgi:chromosome segregation ATPase